MIRDGVLGTFTWIPKSRGRITDSVITDFASNGPFILNYAMDDGDFEDIRVEELSQRRGKSRSIKQNQTAGWGIETAYYRKVEDR